MHLDGARLFNACVATGRKPIDYAQYFDSLMFCFSKGLGAPIGSILTGSKMFIQRAHRIRKMLGGGMRQVGILAAAALYALENNVQRLAEDHQHAKMLANELATINQSAEEQAQLTSERDKLKSELSLLGIKLSAMRSEAAIKLGKEVVKELGELEMGQMQFEVSVSQTVSPGGLPGKNGEAFAFNVDGIDNVELMVSTNPGEPLKPLAKIASTGEISRFTLALKGALSEVDNIPVLVFDEIDIGVGGRSGDIIGRKLRYLAQNHQVICVTHLPQIAVYADSHYCVTKSSVGQRTTSTLTYLEGERRLEELALMLAGPGHSTTVLKNAEELLKKADDWKKSLAKKYSSNAQLSF
jgi:DNA repair protein RecN (Recombination protein N)